MVFSFRSRSYSGLGGTQLPGFQWTYRILLLTVVAVAVAALLDADAQGVVINGDTEMTGTVSDNRYDIYGNLTVPPGETLELRNVTIIFHNPGDHEVGLRVKEGSRLRILDGDDDPLTTDDGSYMNCTPDPWILVVDRAVLFEVRNSVLENMGRAYTDPELGRLNGPRIMATSVELDHATLFDARASWMMSGDTLTIADSRIIGSGATMVADFGDVWVTDSILEVRGFTVQDGQRFEMERSILNFSGLSCDSVDTVIVRNTAFYSSGFSFYWGVVRGTVLDCTFTGRGSLYANATNTFINNCIFNGTQGAWIDSVVTVVDGCAFLEISRGLYHNGEILSLTNSTFTSCYTGIVLERGVEDVTLSGLTFINCTNSLKIVNWEGTVSVVSCDFRDVQGVSIQAEDFRYMLVDDCSFNNVTIGVQTVPKDPIVWWLKVTNCTFKGFTTGVLCYGANLTVTGSSFDVDYHSPYTGVCIKVYNLVSKARHNLTVEDCDFANAYMGLDLNPGPAGQIWATIAHCEFRKCDTGLKITNLTSCTLEDLVFTECHEGARVFFVGLVEAFSISIDNGTNGLMLVDCVQVDLGHISLRDLTGWAVMEYALGGGHWNISRDVSYRNANFQLVGSLLVTASLGLVDVEMSILEDIYESPGFQVVEGGSLTLDGTTLSGDPTRPFSLRISGGATLEAVNSTIAYCGKPSSSLDRTGPYLEGGIHDISGLRLVKCNRGLVLVNCQVLADRLETLDGTTGLYISRSEVTVLNSTIFGVLFGISASDSNLTFRGCRLNSSLIALSMDLSRASFINSTILASQRTMSLDASKLHIEASNITTEGNLVGMLGSDLVFWNCTISPLRAPGGTVDMSTVSFYDTMHEGDWTVRGVTGRVTYYWSHAILVVHHWDRSRAVGRQLAVFRVMDPARPVASGVVGLDGGPLEFWLIGIQVDDTADTSLGPYIFRVQDEGVLGERTSPGDRPWEGLLEVFDVEGPTVGIIDPVHNTIMATIDIRIEGTVHDIGSGVGGLELSFDDEHWSALTFGNGTWHHQLEALDGRHTLQVRVWDMEGNTGEANITFVVDTTLPLVVFSNPFPGTPFTQRTILLSGFVVIDDGTAIFQVLVDGLLVPVDVEGRFEVNVTLSLEGANTFSVEAIDLAGNRDTDQITLFLDLVPPILEIEPIPTLTNAQELMVKGSVLDEFEVTVTLGGDLVATLTTGTFTTTIILSLGTNHLLFEATDTVGNRVGASYTVVLDTTVNGTISKPLNGAKVTHGLVYVAVQTEPYTWVRIRDHTDWALARENGTLERSLTLEGLGEYELVVEFRDRANNTLVRAIVIVLVEEEPEEAAPGWLWWALPAAIIIGIAVYVLVRGRRPREGDAEP